MNGEGLVEWERAGETEVLGGNAQLPFPPSQVLYNLA
jgi:hypothetical protein